MSSAELNAFEKQLTFLSYSEQLSVIEFLVNLLKNKREETSTTKSESSSQKIFALMDANPIYSNGQKWTREEIGRAHV